MPPLKYWKIKEYLEQIVVQPEAALARMPTIREMMGRFNVSLATVNRALDELERDGVIIRRQGARIVAARNATSVRASRVPEAHRRGEKNLVLMYNDYFGESPWRITHGLIQNAGTRKCRVADCKLQIDTSTEMIVDFVKKQRDCAGLILLIGTDRMDTERIEALAALDMPVVVVDSMYFYDNLPGNVFTVSPDPVDCARKIVEVLVARGHRRIGYVRNEPRSEYTDRHLKAFAAALRDAGVPFEPEQRFSSTIRSWESSLDAAVQLTVANLETIRRLELTALAYKSSNGALVAIKPLGEAGLSVPGDISLIGEGDYSMYGYLSPGLTCVSADYGRMTALAVDIVLGDERPSEANQFVSHSVVLRDSVRDLNA